MTRPRFHRPVIADLRPSGEPDPPEVPPAPFRLAYRLDEVAAALGVSRRLIERERSAGRFPKPDLTIGRAPLWTRETLTAWVARGSGL
jgi:predicted DNA-binding transcriptional regulator AlpA